MKEKFPHTQLDSPDYSTFFTDLCFTKYVNYVRKGNVFLLCVHSMYSAAYSNNEGSWIVLVSRTDET
jgi:hypothetical protein